MTIRSLTAIGVIGAALLLGGCNTADRMSNTKAIRPIPAKTLALMEKKGMTRRDPVLIRIYKEDSELELWKKDRSGRYALLKTYEICRFSGTLGPKKVEGDGQSPEGFYSVSPAQLNPNSQYYLSFNLGYPNAFDRSHGRTGAHLMVHGDCLSKGCYAMTDEQIAELYAVVREALHAGQPSFQVQAFPFRMTAENMARRRNDNNFAFWKNLKEGADHFELTKLEPKVNVCDRRYVFDATPKNGSFNPSAPCPEYEIHPSVAMAMAAKKRTDDEKFNTLVSGGLETALAYTPQNGRLRRTLSDPIKKPDPAPVMTAKASEPPQTGSVALALAGSDSSVPVPAPSPYASAQPKSGGMFSWLRGDDAAPAETPRTAAAEATPPARTARADQAPQVNRPVAASMPAPEKSPFYKRWFSKADEAKPAAPAAPQPAPAPQSAAAPAAASPAPAPAPRPQPAVEQRASVPAANVDSGPNLPPIPQDAIGATIMQGGSFR